MSHHGDDITSLVCDFLHLLEVFRLQQLLLVTLGYIRVANKDCGYLHFTCLMFDVYHFF